MKKHVSKILFISLISVLMFSSPLTIFAQWNKEEATENESITLKVNVPSNSKAVEGVIEYNKNVFNELSKEDLEILNDWSFLEYNKDNGKFIAVNKSGSGKKEAISVNLTVKEGAKAGDTDVSIQVVTSDGRKDVKSEKKSETIKVVKNEDVVAGDPSLPENKKEDLSNNKVNSTTTEKTMNIERDNVPNNKYNSINNNKPEDSPLLEKLPVDSGNSGNSGRNWVYILIIFLIIIVCYIFYKCNKENKDKLIKLIKNSSKNNLILLAGIIILGGSIGVFAFSMPSGDVNNDDTVDYLDISLLEKHLIGLKDLPSEAQKIADMNSDGYLTVTDLVSMLHKVEDKIDYNVNISNNGSVNYYPNKGENIKLSFLADVTNEGIVKKVVIDNEEIDVTPLDGKIYSFNRKVKDVSGVEEFKLSHVILDNNKKIKVNYTEKVDVLKDKPYITDYHVEEDSTNKKAKIKFTLVDKDKALTSGIAIVTNKKSNSKIYEKEISVGENEIEIDIDDSETYTFEVRMGYDLDTNALNDTTGEQNNVDNKSVLLEEFKVAFDYKMSISDLSIEKDALEKNEDVVLRFKSTNVTKFYPKTVSVNGNEYTLNKEGDVYSTVLTKETSLGATNLVVDSIVLNNGKKFNLTDLGVSNKLVTKRLKERPSVSDFSYNEDTVAKNLALSFSLVDNDNTLVGTKLVVSDNNGNTLKEYDAVKGKNTVDIPTNMSTSYTVKIVSEYTLMEGEEGKEFNYKNQTLLSKKIKALPNVEIVSSSISKRSLEKNESTEVTYNFKSTSDIGVSYIQVNSIKHKAIKVSDNVYKINYTASSNSGVYSLNVEKVTLEDGSLVYPSNSLQAEVLKDVPTIEEFKTEDLINDSKIKMSFNLKDKDNAFVEGHISQKGKNGLNSNIVKGENNIDVDVIEGEVYTIDFNVKYNRSYLGVVEETKVLDTKEISLVIDYGIGVSDLKTFNGTDETVYFSKGEDILLLFNSSNKTKSTPVEAVVNNNTYPVEVIDGKYRIKLKGLSQSGVKTLTIESITLSNTKVLKVTDNNTTKVEILKDKPTATEFAYTETDNNKINATFKIGDQEKSIQSGQVIVYDEKQQEIMKQDIVSGDNTIIFDKNSKDVFSVKVVASYDLDSNTLKNRKNEYKNKTLLEEEVVLFGDRKIEMKDIMDVIVYEKEVDYSGNMNYREVDKLPYVYVRYYPDNYIARVKMKNMPDFYARIKDYRIENNKCYLVIDYDNVTQYTNNGQQQNKLEVLYGDVEGSYAIGNSFSNLMSKIKANPTGTFVLTRDYDASEYASDYTSLAGKDFTFRGTIDGNGHTIYNLNGPIFNTLDNATIKNLKLENAYLGNSVSNEVGVMSTFKNAALANTAYAGTTISNVHVKDLTIITRFTGVKYGGIVGSARGGSKPVTIKDSSVTNLKITGTDNSYSEGSQIGGIAGAIQNTTIEDCYVEGIIKGKSGLGGIVGEIDYTQPSGTRSTIKHSISKVNITCSGGGNGGILGLGSSGVTLTQNISLSIGTGANRIYGSGNIILDSKNIAISESTLNENTGSNIKTISKSDFSPETLKELGFSKDKWNFNNCSYDNLPALNNNDPRNTKGEQTSSNIYIPNHEILKQKKDYNPNKQIAYSNLYKLMPFYDSKYLIIDGKKIREDHILNQKIINKVLAFDANNKVMMYLTEKNYDDIKYIRIVFEDGTTEDYDVTYKYKGTEKPKKMYGRVAMYKIDDLGIEYNYDRYIIKQDAKIINNLVDYIQSLDYDKDLKNFVDLQSYDKRGYAVLKAYFNDVIKSKENAKEFVMNLLANIDGYSVTQENDILDYVINQKVINTEKFKKVLFAYNYYSRFYGVEMGGTTVSDLMIFKSDVYRPNIKFNDIIDSFWNAEYKSAHVINAQYRDNLGPLIGMKSQGDMIERAIYALTDYKDPNEWFTEYFKGRNLLTESAAKDYVDKADYRAWTQIKKQPKYIMHILTLPKDSGFIVSAPGTFLVGSQMVYLDNPRNKNQQEKLLSDMQKFGDQMANFYNNVLGIIDASYLNKYADIQIDSINVKKYGKQSNGKCTDPFHINFNDLLNAWFTANGAAAYAMDGEVHYESSAIRDIGEIWTHEIGHNQSYKLFFKGNGFRPIGGNNINNLGTEDYTDGHTTQSFGDGEVNWNLSHDYTPDKLITTNLTQDRINSVQELDSYYKGMYEAIDFLDYVEAKAFLQLTPKEQAKVAVQIQYPDPNKHSTVTWKRMTTEDFEKMNLETIEDLWDNRIAIRPGVGETFTQSGDTSYGSEDMYIRRWYQPYNDNGRTHTWGFTYTTWQMLGIGGYENGYLTWFTGKSKTDLDAIKKITKDDTMTWKKFKKERYKLMEDSFDTIPYIDAESLVKDYVDALKTDASNQDRNVTASTNVRRINYHYLKRITNDFRKEVLTGKNDAIHISTAEEFKEKLTKNKIGNTNGNTNYYTGNFVLDNDIDLSKIEADGGTIIDGYFIGKLDGNGYKLIGNKVPIFNNIKFSHISDLTIEDSKIVIKDASNEKTGSLAKVVEYSTLDNITAKNVNVSANKETGALVGNMIGALVQNTHVIDVEVSGTARVGAMAGYVDKTQILESSTKGEISGTENAVGGFAGEFVNGSVIKDCYSIGRAKGYNDVGGFAGYVDKSSIINCFSKTRADGNDGIASFVGKTVNNATIKNNITLVNQFKGYKFDGRTENDRFVNFSGNYENEGNAGTSTRNRKGIDFNGKIDVAPEEKVKTEKFYIETLGWNEKIWDFSKVSSGGVPKLRNSDPNDNTSAVETYHIKSADEFIEKITEDPNARYIIDNDIDFSSKNKIIDVEFRGILEGNGHKLTGNKTPIFDKLNKAKITGLILKGSTITAGQDNVGALAKTATNSEIENVHVIEATITGTNSKAGGIVGYAENSTLKASSSNAFIYVSGNNVGGLVGEITKSTIIENCYSSGVAKGNENVGGLVGNVVGSTIKYSYSATTVNGSKGIAGFIGQSTENSTIQNNIALGNQNKYYKFDGKTENGQFGNYSGNYEYKENRGKSTLLREGIKFDGKIGVATEEQIKSKEFYTKTLGWNEEIWDLSSVTKEYTPKLKNLDPNETKAIGVYKAKIKSADKFIEELTKHPNGEFTIMADLDFSGKEYKVGSVLIPGVFEGVIKGEGHTIKNLKNTTIFEQFDGEVYNLNVDKFDYGSVYFTGIHSQYVSPGQSDKTQSNIAVFAKKSFNATYSNMKFSKITMFGNENVAVVVSVDNNSTFEKINISQAYVNAVGKKTSLFISEKTGGFIKNCYVHGEMSTDGNDGGGIIGIAHGDVTIENVISNICGSEFYAKGNGLFIGKMDKTTEIKNSASIGIGRTANMNNFAATIEDRSKIQNCYENSSGKGISNVDGKNIKSVDKEKLKTKDFYVNTLGFDDSIWRLDNIEERYYTESVRAHGTKPENFPLMIFFGLK